MDELPWSMFEYERWKREQDALSGRYKKPDKKTKVNNANVR